MGIFAHIWGPSFLGASDRRGQSPRAPGERRPRQLSQLETTVSRPFSLIHSVEWTESERRVGRSAFIGLKIG
jgi:hypothetical protein